ncbi:actin cytoskeleton-regulatory complex protein PAN1-like, partial [Schistocerca piceifrons]|uniref:actin cytoskeleton-regulatory complex protein PAN1-like n=1 Tax=Schistocerca piceifrons TaxID=274613 RepID=UPI001F5F5619
MLYDYARHPPHCGEITRITSRKRSSYWEAVTEGNAGQPARDVISGGAAERPPAAASRRPVARREGSRRQQQQQQQHTTHRVPTVAAPPPRSRMPPEGAAAGSMAAKVDPSDPHVRKLVYNMYRGMLGTYNDKANALLSTMPQERVREDQGIADKLESMIRQSSQISGGGSPSPGPGTPAGDGVSAAPAPPPFPAPAPPAPPPPPPPGAGALPAVRIATE